MRVAFHTLGCKVNQYETEAIREAFVKHGATVVPENRPADVYIVNTCTVTGAADRKSRQYIRRMKRLSPAALMVVTGCYAQVSADALAALPEVDLVIGNNLKSTIYDRVAALLEERDAIPKTQVLPRAAMTQYEEQGQVLSGAASMLRAYIKIEEGCDRFCSYCRIPYARGPVRSRAMGDILAEAKGLIERGCPELVLTGINTALYGTEPGYPDVPREAQPASALEKLLAELDALDGDFRIRLSSLEPTVVDRQDVERIIRRTRLCRHLHLSAQSGSDRVLQAMHRGYTRQEYLDIAAAIRARDPLYGITTDIIVGFPGETEADFADTLALIRQAGFGRVHGFRYSPRRGTAATQLPDPVPGAVKNERMQRLQAAARAAARDFEERNLCSRAAVLIEERENGMATGYTDNYIKAYIPDEDQDLAVGASVTAVLIDHYQDGCLAEVAGKGR